MKRGDMTVTLNYGGVLTIFENCMRNVYIVLIETGTL